MQSVPSIVMNMHDELFARLSRSKFRSSFHLRKKERAYVTEKGMEVILQHAFDFVETRLSQIDEEKDGSQTPMKGHPVFLAQHATATCCRGCLEKWHHIPKGYALTSVQKKYVVSIIMEWIHREMGRTE